MGIVTQVAPHINCQEANLGKEFHFHSSAKKNIESNKFSLCETKLSIMN